VARTLVGTRIRENRRARNLNQKQLAAIAGISGSYLNLIEHNRRGIAGKTLLSLARALEIDPRSLSDGSDRALVDRVKKAAFADREIKTELDHAEEFTARYPGFARLIGRLQDRSDRQQQDFAALSDRMKNDPFFAEAIHLMLSTITTIKSTSEILAMKPAVPDNKADRFLSNLLSESERLAKTATDVLKHFEPSSDVQNNSPDNSPFEALLDQNHFFLDALEDESATIAEIIDKLDLNESEAKIARKSFINYQRMARKFPIPSFLPMARELSFDPLRLAHALSSDVPSICFRLAHLPVAQNTPNFGLLQCDGAGAVLYRKQLQTFALPRFGGACALWPVYRSLSIPLQPITAYLDMPTGERLFAFSYSYPTETAQIGMPARTESLMLFTPDYRLFQSPNHAGLPQLPVGVQCAVCPRKDCSARRSPYLLGG